MPPFRSTRTHIIATLRADYLPELFARPALYDIAKRGVDLREMSADELREAVQQPLRVTYLDKDKRFQAELVERLATDAAEDAACLPLLQVTLEEIWRKGMLTLGAYTNLSDAIEQQADKVLDYQDYDAAQPQQPRSAEEQAAIVNLCLNLVDVSLDDEARRDVRRRRSKDELSHGAPEQARLIDTLTQARLLSVDTESDEPTRVEVELIHETLLTNWDHLRQAIAQRRHELRQRARFEQQLKEWIGQNRSDDYLLSGVRLAEARDLERQDDVAVRNSDARDFIRRSVEHEEARQQKELDGARRLAEAERLRAEEQTRSAVRLKRVLVGVALLAVAAIVLGALAVAFGIQSDAQQRLSRSRELASVALNQSNTDSERGLLIAIEAENVADTYEAHDVLRQLLLASRLRAVLRGHEGPVSSAQFSPDGLRVVTASWDETARVWEAATGKEVAVLRGHDDYVVGAQLSPDGRRVVTASWDKTARIYLVHTGDLIALAKTRVTRELTCEERVQYLREDVVCATPTPAATPMATVMP